MGAHLLEEILANPADAAVRLVYADALLASGEPRGELIVIDHELARGTSDRIPLLRRRRALLAANARVWWPEIPLDRLDVRDGFVVRVAATHAELVAASRLFEREPITSVEMIDATAARSQFEPAAWQARVTDFTIRGRVGDQGLAVLVGSQFAGQLQAIDVAGCGITRLPELEPLARCRRLQLAGNRIGNARERLLAWSGRDRLEALDVRGALAPDLVAPVVHALGGLRELKLSGIRLAAHAPAIAEALAGRPTLARVELIATGLGEYVALLERGRAPQTQLVVAAPSQLELDLVSTTLVLVRDRNDGWAIEIDHEPRYIMYRGQAHREYGMTAPLGPLIGALVAGAARSPVHGVGGGTKVVLASRSGTDADDRRFRHVDTAHLSLSPTGVNVTFDSVVDTDA